jgi:hypothetical protein
MGGTACLQAVVFARGKTQGPDTSGACHPVVFTDAADVNPAQVATRRLRRYGTVCISCQSYAHVG